MSEMNEIIKLNMEYISKKLADKNKNFTLIDEDGYWHSGTHLSDEKLELYSPVSATISAFKMEEKDFFIALPENISSPEDLGKLVSVESIPNEISPNELYEISDNNNIYELKEEFKNKKIRTGSTNYLLLKYEVNELCFYMLLMHIAPYEKYTKNVWFTVKDLADDDAKKKVPFYIERKLKIPAGYVSSLYIFDEKYPANIIFTTTDKAFISKNVKEDDTVVSGYFNNEEKFNDKNYLKKVNTRYLEIDDEIEIIRTDANSALLVYRQEGDSFIPQYAINSAGFYLKYKLSENTGNDGEYRKIEIPRCEEPKEEKDKRKIYRIGLLSKKYIPGEKDKKAKRNCSLWYPVLLGKKDWPNCCIITEETAKKNQIETNDSAKIQDAGYLVVDDKATLYSQYLKKLILPTKEVKLKVVERDNHNASLYKVTLDELRIYISAEDNTKKEDGKYYVNAEIKNPIYLYDKEYPIIFDKCKTFLETKDYNSELKYLKENFFLDKEAKNLLTGKEVFIDKWSEDVSLTVNDEGESGETENEKIIQYDRFMIKNINPDFQFYIHEDEVASDFVLKDDKDDKDDKAFYSKKNRNGPYTIEILEKPLEEIEYLFFNDDKNIKPVHVASGIFNSIKTAGIPLDKLTSTLTVYGLKNEFAVYKEIHEIEQFKYDKDFSNKQIFDKIKEQLNKINGFLSEPEIVMISDKGIEGAGYVKLDDVEIEAKRPVKCTLQAPDKEDDKWKFMNNIVLKYSDKTKSNFLGFLKLSEEQIIKCKSDPIVRIEDSMLYVPDAAGDYYMSFASAPNQENLFISNYFNPEKVKTGKSISPADFIGHCGDFFDDKNICHFGVFMKEELKDVKTEHFLLTDKVKYYKYKTKTKSVSNKKLLLPTQGVNFKVLDIYGEFYKVCIESLQVFINEKDVEIFKNNNIPPLYYIPEPLLNTVRCPDYPIYIYDYKNNIKYKNRKNIDRDKLVADMASSGISDVSEYFLDYGKDAEDGLKTLGKIFLYDYRLLKIKGKSAYSERDEAGNLYQRYCIYNIQSTGSFWIKKSELTTKASISEGKNSLTVKYTDKAHPIPIYGSPDIYELQPVGSAEMKGFLPLFVKNSVVKKLRCGDNAEESVYGFNIDGINGEVYIKKSDCEKGGIKKKKIKMDDYFTKYDPNTKKAYASNKKIEEIDNLKKEDNASEKIVCAFPFEFNPDSYTEENYQALPKEQYEFYKGIMEHINFKECDVFKNNELDIHKIICFNPFYFLKTLNDWGMFEFNPYEGESFTYGWGYYDTNGATYPKVQEVKSNPGFAPVSINTEGVKAFGKLLANPNGLFREKYPGKNGPYGHEGLDFDGEIGTEIYSFINGVVEKIPKSQGSLHYGMNLVIKSSNGYLYLLGHLSKICVIEGETVYPGKLVAKVGNTGNCKSSGGGDGSHLHVSVYKAKKWEDIITDKTRADGGTYIWSNDLINPFNYEQGYFD